MRGRAAICAFLAAALVCSCSPHRGSRTDGCQLSDNVREFPVLKVPSIYTSPEDRLKYACGHYWDEFLTVSSAWRCDSLTIDGVPAQTVEEHFATYVKMLEQVDSGIAREGMASLFRKVEAKQLSDSLSNVYGSFASMAEKYLYDPNSPYRDEEIFLPYVQGLASSPLSSEALRPSYGHEVEVCSTNRIGGKAPDFEFKDIAGRTHTLYGVEGEYTLLFFSNPGCEACRTIVETIEGDLGLEWMMENGQLSIVNVYIDEDIDAWKAYQGFYPENWLNGYDPTYSIRQELKYCVRAIPSLYLLDSEKRILLKDAPENRAFAYLDAVRRKQ